MASISSSPVEAKTVILNVSMWPFSLIGFHTGPLADFFDGFGSFFFVVRTASIAVVTSFWQVGKAHKIAKLLSVRTAFAWPCEHDLAIDHVCLVTGFLLTLFVRAIETFSAILLYGFVCERFPNHIAPSAWKMARELSN